MKTFENFGLRIRKDLPRNYYSLWMGLKTYRMDLGPEIKLPYGDSEFYDISCNNKCNANPLCQFCYIEATHKGENWKDICETWRRWMDTFPEDEPVDLKTDKILQDIVAPPKPGEKLGPDEFELKLRVLHHLRQGGKAVYTKKPTQIACGGLGESTIHPDFPRFLQTVYETDVVPNYTTNGVYLSPEVLEATRAFVGGVAVSYGNRSLRTSADKTINTLLKEGDCKVMIHHLIYDKTSVDDFLRAADEWGTDIHYHVLLPLKAHGRSKQEMTEEAYLYLTSEIRKKGLRNLAFGMWFLPWMKKFPGSLEVYDYPAETYSSNALLRDGKVLITPSSYDLKIVKEI